MLVDFLFLLQIPVASLLEPHKIHLKSQSFWKEYLEVSFSIWIYFSICYPI